MSKHNVEGTDIEEIQYAETMVIDEGGIDLQIDGTSVLSASFDNVDNYQLAYEVLPESFVFPEPRELNEKEWHETLDAMVQQTGVPSDLTDSDLEITARLFLTALARRKGYEKK